jgi:NhaP-type Na+/H+ or K+/H+ antiporter/rhodanese-related sulfurtransferase
MFGLIGVVVIIAALLSGYIERNNFPQVAVFLGLGLLIGPNFLGFLDSGLDSPILRVVATLSLTLVLFTDALTIDVKEIRKHIGLTLLILGPGTLIATALMALAAFFLLGRSVPLALILAAPLASTDPVMLRSLLRRPHIHQDARLGLKLESGLNDVVLLPIVLLAIQWAIPSGNDSSLVQLLLQMLVLGPLAGMAVAFVGIFLLDQISRRVGIRREYESLFSLGIALAAYAAAESLHGSGFLAAFAAGLTISSVDVDLCDCFREYGETTAEVFLLFTFVLLGTSVIWHGIQATTLIIAVFVAIALLARPLGLLVALVRHHTPPEAKRLIIWFGPRGLSTLLLALLPVFEGVPGSSQMFQISTVVVLVSVVIHGGSMMLLRDNSSVVPETTGEPATMPELMVEYPAELSANDVRVRKERGEPILLADVRRDAAYLSSPERIEEATRIHPQFARRDADALKLDLKTPVALFCACPNDATSRAVAQELRNAGWENAFSVSGGWDALVDAGFSVLNQNQVQRPNP